MLKIQCLEKFEIVNLNISWMINFFCKYINNNWNSNRNQCINKKKDENSLIFETKISIHNFLYISVNRFFGHNYRFFWQCEWFNFISSSFHSDNFCCSLVLKNVFYFRFFLSRPFLKAFRRYLRKVRKTSFIIY